MFPLSLSSTAFT
jgi:hypothetical protein